MPHFSLVAQPGYYEDGAFGIRIESLLVARHKDFAAPFAGTSFLSFEVVTCCPIDGKLVNGDLLTVAELQWLNDYNAACRAKVRPLCMCYHR